MELPVTIRCFRTEKLSNLLISLLFLWMFLACNDVTVPDSHEKDAAPKIYITVVNQTNNTTKEYQTDDIIPVKRGAKLKFIVVARNPVGGVKELFFTLFDQISGSKMHVPFTPPAVTPTKAPIQLSIATWNNQAITHVYDDPNKYYTASAEATNYNLHVTDVVLRILVLPDPPSLVINSFKVQPDLGVFPGQNFTISWDYKKLNDNSPVDLVVAKKYFQEPEAIIYSELDAPLTNSITSPSGKSGFPEFKLVVRYRNNPGIIAVSTPVTRQVQPTQPNTPQQPYLVVVGPNTNPFILYEKLPFTISYTIANAGNKDSDAFDVDLTIDGVKEGGSKSIPALGQNKSTDINWSVTKELSATVHVFDLINKTTGGAIGHSQLIFSTK